ncbi:MAG TPA: hypothetical protein VG603_02550 [Chitinophagales bacterium]|nr:hypothetical protein [Chitinophagales bacterium]
MKTKSILLLLLCLCGGCIYAGNGDSNKKETRPYNRLYFGFYATPAVSYRYIKENYIPIALTHDGVQTQINHMNNNSHPEFGMRTGFKLGVNCTHWLAIESGIEYTQFRYRYDPDGFFYSNTGIGNDTFSASYNYRYHYISIPLALNFVMGQKRVKGIITMGTDFDFLVRERTSYTYNYTNGITSSGALVQDYNFNNFNLSPFFGIGADFYITHHLILRILPQAQMQALKNNNSYITEYLWNVGVNVSLLFGVIKAGG